MKIRNTILVTIVILLIFSVNSNNIKDVSTNSNYDEVVQTFLHLTLNANFDRNVLTGNILIKFQSLTDNLNIIKLDSWDLDIYNIVNEKSHENLNYKIITEEFSQIGSQLNIYLNKSASKGETVLLRIYYSTKSSSKSTKWLTKEMTLGKMYPFMFTESEKILSRTIFPCQDTPAVKAQVKLTLTAPSNLVAVFGGTQYKEPTIDEDFKVKTYYFEQKIEIPTYLIAFAIGDIDSRQVSNRISVMAEPGILEKAKNELDGFEDYIKKAEEYLFDYEWGTFNVLVLPPGNPYGAMENPNLVYVPQTLIVGDKSLIHVLAHELAHSWTGNLVTNSNWNDFWLNEGFAVFVERKLVELKSGEDSKNLQSLIGLQNMQKDIDRAPKSSKTALNPNIGKNNPDDYSNYIPYEKGYNLLVYLENVLGKESFQKMLREYLLKYRYKSVDVDDLLSHFNYFLEKFYGYKKVKDFRSKMNLTQVITEVGNPSFSNDFSKKFFNI